MVVALAILVFYGFSFLIITQIVVRGNILLILELISFILSVFSASRAAE